MPAPLTLSRVDSPIGTLALATDDLGRVRGATFDGGAFDGLRRAMQRLYPRAETVEDEAPAAVAKVLARYFLGVPEALTEVAWSLEDADIEGDRFQPAVWRALAGIPSGATISYGEIARRAGQPGAAQAAGVALHRNPLPLVLPCHRVVGADGAMVGFGGGLERKAWLLRHEGALLI